MKISVKAQREMSFRETMDFCSSSIRHRFSRSLLTLSVVILAVAFFMYLQCSNLFREGIRAKVMEEIRENRTGAGMASLLFASHNRNDFFRMLAGCDDELLMQLGNVFSWEKEKAFSLRRLAGTVLHLESCFKALPAGKRQKLLQDGKGSTDLEKFSSLPTGQIIRRSRSLGIQLPADQDELYAFAAGFPEISNSLIPANSSWNAFQERLRTLCGIKAGAAALRMGRIWLLNAGPKEKKALEKFFKQENFIPGKSRWQKMMAHLYEQQAREQISAFLARPEIRQKWRSRFGSGSYTRLDEKLAIIDSRECKEFAGPLSDTQRSLVARSTRERLKLNALEAAFLPAGSDSFRDDRSRQFYLMTLAFLVCVIGISNAMLMSITERFTEIATLKCLGATDWFILIQIVLESLMQGIAGGIAGIFLGSLAAACANLFSAGARLAGAWDWYALGGAALWALAAGTVLSILAAIYPACKAAAMAPMEAMRVQ